MEDEEPALSPREVMKKMKEKETTFKTSAAARDPVKRTSTLATSTTTTQSFDRFGNKLRTSTSQPSVDSSNQSSTKDPITKSVSTSSAVQPSVSNHAWGRRNSDVTGGSDAKSSAAKWVKGDMIREDDSSKGEAAIKKYGSDGYYRGGGNGSNAKWGAAKSSNDKKTSYEKIDFVKPKWSQFKKKPKRPPEVELKSFEGMILELYDDVVVR